jgi:hypothetical protein
MTKTGEMNQLIAQLELIQQVLTKVEYGTQQIENVLKEMDQGEKLLHAEASLDVAIQSANNLYYNHTNNNNDKKKRVSLLLLLFLLFKTTNNNNNNNNTDFLDCITKSIPTTTNKHQEKKVK